MTLMTSISIGAGFDAYGENRLVQITRTDGVVVDYTYDARGRRVRKTVANGEDRWFVYDGWNLVAEYNVSTGSASASLSPDTVYTWGQDVSGTLQGAGGVGGLLAVRFGDQDYYPLYDGNGNVTEYLDNAGVVVAHYEYDAFGKVAAISGSQAGDFAFQFSTKYADAESGLSYYGFRYYDSLSGRWMSRDPIQEAGGWNLYAFLTNAGINSVDKLGMFSCAPCSSQCDKCWPNPGDRSKCEADCRNAKLSMKCGPKKNRGGSNRGGNIRNILLGNSDDNGLPKGIKDEDLRGWNTEKTEEFLWAIVGVIADLEQNINAGTVISAVEAWVGVQRIRQCLVFRNFRMRCLQKPGAAGSERKAFCDAVDVGYRKTCS